MHLGKKKKQASCKRMAFVTSGGSEKEMRGRRGAALLWLAGASKVAENAVEKKNTPIHFLLCEMCMTKSSKRVQFACLSHRH
jgi:hypothetical protein